jgi:hypothetical protein
MSIDIRKRCRIDNAPTLKSVDMAQYDDATGGGS